MTREHSQRALAQIPRFPESGCETIHRRMRGGEQSTDLGIACGIRAELAPLFDLAQTMPERTDQKLAAGGVVEEIILQIRIALDDPDIAQHFEQHPRRTPRAPLGAKLAEQVPYFRPEQADDDLAVRERRVVVRDLAQPRGFDVGLGQRRLGNCTHGQTILSQWSMGPAVRTRCSRRWAQVPGIRRIKSGVSPAIDAACARLGAVPARNCCEKD